MMEKTHNKGLLRQIEELKQSNRLLQQQIKDLQGRESHSSSLLAGIPVGVYRTDSDGLILEANPALVEMLDYDDKESLLSANSAQFYVRPEDQREQRRILARDGILRGFETELRRADGSTFWVKDSAKVVEHADGRLFFEGSLEDIDERKETERSLIKSQQIMRGILDATLETIVLIDRQGIIVAANKTTSLRLGVGIRDLVGASVYGLFPADVAETRKQKWEKVFAEGRPLFFEDGRDGRTYAQSAYPVFDNNSHRVEHVVLFASDITERKQAEENLRKSEALLNRSQQMASMGSFVWDLRDDALLWSKNMYAIHGVDEETFAGNLTEISRRLIHPNDQGRIQAETRKMMEAGRVWSMEFRIIRPDGEERVMRSSGEFELDELGRPIKCFGVHQDITDLKRAEEERRKLESQLRQSQKLEAVGTLAGGVAHDFNNILGIIVGNAELAMFDLAEWNPAQESLKEIREASLRARDLVTQILLFARKKEHTISNIQVAPIAKECLKMLRASIPSTVEIRQKISEDLPPVQADPSQIQQVIMNLCANAGQALEVEGGVLEFVMDSSDLDMPLDTFTGRLPEGAYIRLIIRDNGPGIPPDVLEQIFDPFFTTKGVGEGTGLGLAVVHGIIQDRKGGITLETEEGKGTAFTVYLPASGTEFSEKPANGNDVLPKGKEKILFVDDEPMILKLGQRMLERQGYEVESRASGTDALECFKNDPGRFDLVVTDMSMPGLRGDKLAEEVLKIRPDIPVILSTGFSKQISEERSKELGIRAFVLKPLTAQELTEAVRRVLDEK